MLIQASKIKPGYEVQIETNHYVDHINEDGIVERVLGAPGYHKVVGVRVGVISVSLVFERPFDEDGEYDPSRPNEIEVFRADRALEVKASSVERW